MKFRRIYYTLFYLVTFHHAVDRKKIFHERFFEPAFSAAPALTPKKTQKSLALLSGEVSRGRDIPGVQAPGLADGQAPALHSLSPVGIFLTSSCRFLVWCGFAMIPIKTKRTKCSNSDRRERWDWIFTLFWNKVQHCRITLTAFFHFFFFFLNWQCVFSC